MKKLFLHNLKNLLRVEESFLLLLLVYFILIPGIAFSIDISEQLGATFVAHFDSTISNDIPSNNGIKNHGATIIDNGISGKALQMLNNEYIEIDPNLLLNTNKGTFSFWLRPHWSYSVSNSHTFLSFTWDQQVNSYFVLTDGWWEDNGGKGRTYFIFNNQDKVKSDVPVYYKQGEWIHFALTWENGRFAKLYINGVLSRESEHTVRNSFKIKNNIMFGTDRGCYLSENRWADIDIDELSAFNRVLSNEEILSLYKNFKKYTPLSNRDGTLKQMRAIIDEGKDWLTDEGAYKTISKIKNTGFNVYVPCVWHGKGTCFPSDKAIKEVDVSFDGGDPLNRIIKLSHENNLELHAWFIVAARQRDFYNEFYDGSPEKAFNLHRPEFRKFMVDLIVDTVQRYDLDGIVLDYIRTMGICTSDYCVQDYQRRFNRNLLQDINLNQSVFHLEPHIQQWMDEDVEAIVRAVSERVRQIKPRVKISVFGAPIPSVLGTNPEGRQEITWANKGYLDAIFIMDYSDNPDFERIEFVNSEIDRQVYVVPILGNYKLVNNYSAVSKKAEEVSSLVAYSLLRWPEGVGIYLLGSLDNEQINELSTTIFSEKARSVLKSGIPNMFPVIKSMK